MLIKILIQRPMLKMPHTSVAFGSNMDMEIWREERRKNTTKLFISLRFAFWSDKNKGIKTTGKIDDCETDVHSGKQKNLFCFYIIE